MLTHTDNDPYNPDHPTAKQISLQTRVYAQAEGGRINGEWKIEPGKPYVARYRFVAFDGAPDRARLDALWHGYARPAAGRLESGP